MSVYNYGIPYRIFRYWCRNMGVSHISCSHMYCIIIYEVYSVFIHKFGLHTWYLYIIIANRIQYLW